MKTELPAPDSAQAYRRAYEFYFNKLSSSDKQRVSAANREYDYKKDPVVRNFIQDVVAMAESLIVEGKS